MEPEAWRGGGSLLVNLPWPFSLMSQLFQDSENNAKMLQISEIPGLWRLESIEEPGFSGWPFQDHPFLTS